MAISVLFTPPAMSAAQYDQAMQRLLATGALPSPGFIRHTCFGDAAKLSVLDVWESQATFDAFSKKLLPILAATGIDPGTPVIKPVHNMVPPAA